MLLGQWRHDLAGLERKLRNQADEASQDSAPTNGKRMPGTAQNGKTGAPSADTIGTQTIDSSAEPQNGATGFLY
jgi:hypothetical protein